MPSTPPDSKRTVIVIAGGDPLLTRALMDLPDDAFIIAADSGLDHALAGGLRPDLVVGDLDSVSEKSLNWARAARVPIDEYPPDKDMTDTELALASALARGAPHVILLGGGGDRLDHSIGAVTALGHASLAICASVSARWGTAEVHVMHGPRTVTLPVRTETTFSLLALHGICTGVYVRGARWPLMDATLVAGSSLGVSNTATSSEIHIDVHSGALTVIFPTQFGGPQ